MGIVNTTVQTIKCDAPGCDKLITFAAPEGEQIIKNTPWLRTARTKKPSVPAKPHCGKGSRLTSSRRVNHA